MRVMCVVGADREALQSMLVNGRRSGGFWCRSWPDSAARREAGSVNDVRALGASFSGTFLVRSSFLWEGNASMCPTSTLSKHNDCTT